MSTQTLSENKFYNVKLASGSDMMKFMGVKAGKFVFKCFNTFGYGGKSPLVLTLSENEFTIIF